MECDGSHTILRDEFVPGLHQLGDLDVRTLHPVIRITDTNELASSRGRSGGKQLRGELAVGIALAATMYRKP